MGFKRKSSIWLLNDESGQRMQNQRFEIIKIEGEGIYENRDQLVLLFWVWGRLKGKRKLRGDVGLELGGDLVWKRLI